MQIGKQSIYLKSISCKGVKASIAFQTCPLYATVSLPATSQRYQTPVDAANGENPEWDCSLGFELSASPSDGQDLLLQFDLIAKVPLLGDRLVGTAKVAVSDLIDGGSSGPLSYQVRGPDGKANGTIQLWYRVEGRDLSGDMSYSSPEPSAPPAAPGADFSYKPPVKPGPVYPAPAPGPAHYNPQFPNADPVCYPPLAGLTPYSSQSISSGPVEPDRVYGAHAGMNYAPYPPPPRSEVYPPRSSELYPPPNSGFGSVAPYYPPPVNHGPPMDQTVSGSTYYPPPGTQYPPAGGSDCCGLREAAEPVLAYPPGNAYYPPPPRYPHY